MSKEKRQESEQKGRYAEALAALFLMFKGYRILARRYRSPMGEIDIIVQRWGVLAFVEVKARGTLDQGLEAVTVHQQKRIARAAQFFLQRRTIPPRTDIRFDVICMYGFKLKHLQNAWSY